MSATVDNVQRYLHDRGLAFTVAHQSDGGTRLHLHPCPLCGKNDIEGKKDSSVLISPTGRLAWNCFHDSCPGRQAREETGSTAMGYVRKLEMMEVR